MHSARFYLFRIGNDYGVFELFDRLEDRHQRHGDSGRSGRGDRFFGRCRNLRRDFFFSGEKKLRDCLEKERRADVKNQL